jgi:hypothetical protein
MTLWTVAFFFRTIEVEGVQPLEGGLPAEIPPRSPLWNEAGKPAGLLSALRLGIRQKSLDYVRMYRRLKAILNEALAAPDRWTYRDVAITPPDKDEFERLSLYHETTGGVAALARKRRDDVIRAGGHVYESAPLAEEMTIAPAE